MSWTPTSLEDNIIVGLSGAHQIIVLVTVLHLASNVKWPPYIIRNATLVIATGMASACWATVVVFSSGTYQRTRNSVLAHCNLEAFVMWASAGILCNASFLRVYRHWKLLYRKDRSMWLTEYQLGLLMVPFMIPTIVYFARPDLIYFEPVGQVCTGKHSLTITLVMGTYCTLLLLTSLILTLTMHHLRKQCNEYDMIRKVASLIVVAPVLFMVCVAVIGPEDDALGRRIQILLSILITGVLFWMPIAQPVRAFLVDHEKYTDIFTHGFCELPTPAQIRASLEDKPTVEELKDEFQRYARTKVAPEVLQFYENVLERDTVDDYFERQAVTMSIIDRYIRHDSCNQLDITDECRTRILNTDVTKFDIFEEARVEVLGILKEQLQKDFAEVTAFRRFHADLHLARSRGRLLLMGSGGVSAPDANATRAADAGGNVDVTGAPSCSDTWGRPPPILLLPSPLLASRRVPVSSSSPRGAADSLCLSTGGSFMCYSNSSSEGQPEASLMLNSMLPLGDDYGGGSTLGGTRRGLFSKPSPTDRDHPLEAAV